MDEILLNAIKQVRELAVIKDYDSIFKLLHRLNKDYPESYIPSHLFARHLMETGELDEALSYSDIAVKRAPFVPGPTFTHAAILTKLERYMDARVQIDILRSLDRTNTYKDIVFPLMGTIYQNALESIFLSISFHNNIDRVLSAVSIILGDTCSIAESGQVDFDTEQLQIQSTEKRYTVWQVDSTLYIQLNSPEDILHNHIVFEGQLMNGVPVISQFPSSGTHSIKKKLDLPSFFQSIIRICDVLHKDPKRLFFVEHGMDSGEWGPEIEFSPSDYERILDLENGAAFGYQINFDLETWWGWVKGRSNPGSGTWIEGEGSKEMISRVKKAIG